jgi:orotidine-5'-phosphate decarboxylase
MDQLLVALDVDTAVEARALADRLRGTVGGVKIGSQLFTSEGPRLVQELVGRGDRVFLDLKFHDIPHTVARAVAAATRLGVWMITIHAAGGAAMMQAARAAADDEAANRAEGPPRIVAVTVLTSMDDAALRASGVDLDAATQVARLALMAQDAGLDGVVASPQEIAVIRERCDPRFTVVTPGIRGAADAKSDQSRTMSAADAIAAGANFLVIGRPITTAPDPRAAAERIAAECRPSTAGR